MDWFEALTGFRETSYADTRAKLKVEESRLQSLVNGKSHAIGDLELVALQTLRDRVKSVGAPARRLNVSVVRGYVRKMHQSPENAGALFQVASQFNLLEMVRPSVTPEHGVTRLQGRSHARSRVCHCRRRSHDLPQSSWLLLKLNRSSTVTRALTRASIFLRRRIDCRVKPGNDDRCISHGWATAMARQRIVSSTAWLMSARA